MDDDDEIHLHVTYASHLDMDEAFCTRMRMAIEAGLEHTRLVSSRRLELKTLNTSQVALKRSPYAAGCNR
jgi:hypothetical protein